MKANKRLARASVSPSRPVLKREGNGAGKTWLPVHEDLRTVQRDDAVQRYIELYDFAPFGYVNFDRSGRIAEMNLTAAQLLGRARERIIGMPFGLFVIREDTELFLRHLHNCRSSTRRVETELRLKNAKGEIIHAELSSTPVFATPHDGVLLYQTAIVD